MSAPALHSLPGPEPENTKQKLRSPGLRLAQQFEAICYWLTMASLATATVYLAYRTVSNAPPPDPTALGWGASTPQWMVDCLPLFVSGICLCEAGHSFYKGMRSWKEIAVGAGFLLLRSLTQWLPALASLTHR